MGKNFHGFVDVLLGRGILQMLYHSHYTYVSSLGVLLIRLSMSTTLLYSSHLIFSLSMSVRDNSRYQKPTQHSPERWRARANVALWQAAVLGSYREYGDIGN